MHVRLCFELGQCLAEVAIGLKHANNGFNSLNASRTLSAKWPALQFCRSGLEVFTASPQAG